MNKNKCKLNTYVNKVVYLNKKEINIFKTHTELQKSFEYILYYLCNAFKNHFTKSI